MNRLAIIGISSLLLVAMVIGVALTLTGHEETYSGGNSSGGGEISETAKAVQSICQPTDFKETCKNTLTSSAGDTTDPKDLIRISFDIVIQHVGVALNKMDILKDAEADPLTHAAYVSCKELLEDSVDDLHQTVDSFDTFDLANLDGYLDDVKTWLSGALTFQGTCLDGFENTTGDAGENMKQLLKISGELTRNGLAMVDEFSKTLAGFNLTGITGRRLLLSDEMTNIPTWVDAGKRRLLDIFNGTLKPDVVVAKDGSGDCSTIAEGLTKVPKMNKEPFVILVKAGVYEEYVEIAKNMSYVVLLGEGPTKTRITGNKNIADGIPTFKTSTFTVQANHFFAKGITFENTAGASKHQAVAARVSSDMAIFYQCSFDGYQDTLFAHAHRQFYRDCTISGTIDFIFGDASALFQNCTMIVKKPLENQACTVTAQGREERRENTGLVLQNCTIIPSKELKATIETVKVFLGRPWKVFSRTVITNSNIDGFVAPEGWSPWAGTFGLDSSFYAEVGNSGAGASLSKRVTWGGIKKINIEEADHEFSGRTFINGDIWIKPTGVPYDSTILNT